MVSSWLLIAALGGEGMGTLERAIERYDTLSSYRVDIRSSQAGLEQYLHYAYKKPGYVRMEFIRPHSGALLVYDPGTNRVRLWPLGLHHFPEMTLRPENRLIRGASGQRVDRSDVGTLLRNVRALAQDGAVSVTDERDSRGRHAWHLDVTGPAGVDVGGIHRYELWLDKAHLLPLQVVSHDASDHAVETVFMEAWEVNAMMPDSLFHPE
jgi:outer membrane lipoprotein-sorting protein